MADMETIMPTTEPSIRQDTIDAMANLGEYILKINRQNGWNVTTPETWDEPNPYRIPAILALIHSEASEALEAYRHGDKDNFLEEIADTVIRCLDCTAGLGLDLGAAVMDKLEKNKSRGFRHGGKKV